MKTSKRFFYLFFGSVFVAVYAFLNWQSLPKTSLSQTECANSISCIKDISGKFDPTAKEGTFLGEKINLPRTLSESKTPSVLGDSTGRNKHIYVDLSKQMLYAKEGDKEVFSFPISSGKWYPTPTGDFRIWVKLRYTRMTGGNPAIHTFYDLPNVPYTMFFYNNQTPKTLGFGLHGAYWHNNFGHPMSHGCVNISIANSERLYNWASPPTKSNTTYSTADDPGTPVTIYGQAPKES